MNKRILLLAAVAVGLSSCSTMYRSGQTPDDVYYSPAPQQRVAYSDNDDEYYDNNGGQDEYVNVQTEQDRSAYSSEDNYLRMKVRNRSLWSSLDDYSYYGGMYSPFSYGYGMGMGMGYYSPYSFYSPYSRYGIGMGLGYGWGGLYSGFYNPYSLYNPYSFYNPYYSYGYGHYYPGLISVKPGNVRPSATYRPRTSNLRSYGNRSRSNAELNSSRNAPVRVFRNNDNNYINPRRSSSSGNTSPRRSIDRSSNSRPTRTFERSNSAPSAPRVAPSSNSGSRSSGGGGSAPSRSPGRGGR